MTHEWPQFSGLKVLVVEDEAIISFMIEDMLRELGFGEVFLAASIPNAFLAVERNRPDVAILDVNLGGAPVYAVAEKLESAGVPFAFASGYGRGGISDAWSGKTVIQKPFDLNRLAEGLRACLAAKAS
jgi:DNA-binding response OmpR family regulator